MITKLDYNTYSTFLFDMDGTLVNTEPLHAKAMVQVLDKHQLKLNMDVEEVFERFTGMTDTEVLRHLFPNLEQSFRELLIEEKNKTLNTVFHAMTPTDIVELTSPGIREFITYLKTQNKKIAVVSASENSVVESTLKAFGLLKEFHFWFGRGSTLKTKPNPDPYIEAMKKFNSLKTETVIFEDSPTGLKSATDSGAMVIPVAPFGKGSYLRNYQDLF